MSLYDRFETDTVAETEGVWFDLPSPNEDGTLPGFKLASMGEGNKEYVKALEAVQRKYRSDIELDILSNEKAKPILLEVFATTILKDWRNIYDKNGESAGSYTPAKGIALMTALPRLYALLSAKASGMDLFRTASVEADAKNS